MGLQVFDCCDIGISSLGLKTKQHIRIRADAITGLKSRGLEPDIVLLISRKTQQDCYH